MRFVKFLAVFALVLGLSQSAFAATATWGEEMDVLPGASDKGWTNFEGNWIPTVTQGPGTWINEVNNGNIGTADNPLVGQRQFTMEYKFKFLAAVQTDALHLPIWVYNSGDVSDPSTIGRTRHGIGYIPGPQTDLVFEVVGAGSNRYNYIALVEGDDFVPYWNQDGVVNEWQTMRVIFDDLAATPQMSMYLNGSLLATVSNPAKTSLMVGQDDPGLYMGTSDGGAFNPVEWDYLRLSTSIVPIGEALNAVPEPSTLSLLGLAGLALLFRRRR